MINEFFKECQKYMANVVTANDLKSMNNVPRVIPFKRHFKP